MMLPNDAKEYFREYGCKFSKKLSEYAVSKMKNKNGQNGTTKHISYESVMQELNKNGVHVDDEDKWNAYYLFNMYYSDFYPNTLKDEKQISSAVKDKLDDPDGYEGDVFVEWYAKIIYRHIPINLSKYI